MRKCAYPGCPYDAGPYSAYCGSHEEIVNGDDY